ncbi:MAG TPA: hypothetical protein V6C81_25120 [Planktothrix sp.]
MRNIKAITAEQILRLREPELLFSHSSALAKDEYYELARLWHPDCTSYINASRVFSQVANLYKSAVVKLSDGTWLEPAEKIEEEVFGRKKFRLKRGSRIKTIEYSTVRAFELGIMYIGEHAATFEIALPFEDLFYNGIRHMSSFKYHDRAMAVEISSSLPQIEERFETNCSFVVVLRKTPEQLLLADVLRHHAHRLPRAEHCGWILNCLFNLCCYMQWAGLTHNAIASTTVFIAPRRHTCALLGGWWYAAPVNTRLLALPESECEYIPADIARDGSADSRSDLDLVRAIGRELLGNKPGVQLSLNRFLPRVLVDWLALPSEGSAVHDYCQWKNEVLRASFGEPKFVELKVDSTNLYKEV